jgi:hypothetical protein
MDVHPRIQVMHHPGALLHGLCPDGKGGMHPEGCREQRGVLLLTFFDEGGILFKAGQGFFSPVPVAYFVAQIDPEPGFTGGGGDLFQASANGVWAGMVIE